MSKEQNQKKKRNKKNYIKRSVMITDEAIGQDLARALSVPLNPNKFLTKRIGKVQENTEHQFLLLKFKDIIKKTDFSETGKLRNDLILKRFISLPILLLLKERYNITYVFKNVNWRAETGGLLPRSMLS